MNPFPHRGARSARAVLAVCAVGVMASFTAYSLRGDPVPGVQTLQIEDLGNFLVLNWNFYYVQLPARFVLEEKEGETISFEDPAALDRNLSDLVSVAFDLRVDGRRIEPIKVASLTVAPNKFCTVKVIYPGKPGGRLEVRAPVLKYFPPDDVINFNVMGMGRASGAVTGNLTAQKGPFPDVIRYEEVADGGNKSMPMEPAPHFFREALRIPWINANWLLIVMILLLTLRPARAIALVVAIAGTWSLLCVLRTAGGVQFPWAMPGLVPGLATAFLGVVAAMRSRRTLLLAAAASGAGLFNACYDLRQTRWPEATLPLPAAVWLCLGFATGMTSVFVVFAGLLWECKKYGDFEREWVSRLCWGAAALAFLLPVERWVFG